MSSRARDAFSPSSNGSADHRDSSDDLDDEITEDQAVLSMFAPTFYLGNTIRQLSSNPPKWVCDACNKTFQRSDRASAHDNWHRGVYPFVCEGAVDHEKCGRAFVSKELRRSHYDRDDATCKQCHLVLRKRNMARHIRECHQEGNSRR